MRKIIDYTRALRDGAEVVVFLVVLVCQSLRSKHSTVPPAQADKR
jgi:hypothetical protein